ACSSSCSRQQRCLREHCSRVTGAGVGYAIEATGRAGALRQAVDCLAQLGICGLIGGAPAGTAVRRDLNHILVGRIVRGILAGDSISDLSTPHMIELYLAGRFRFDRLITFYPLREINQAASDSLYSRVVKPVLRSWQYSGHPQIHRTRRAPIIAASEPQAPEDARLGQEPGPPI